MPPPREFSNLAAPPTRDLPPHQRLPQGVTSPFTLFYSLGAAQGLFLAALLFTKRRVPANRLLASVMLAFSLDLAMAVYHGLEWYTEAPHLIGLDYPLALAYGPLLYLYARTLAEGRLPERWALHFAPFAALVLGLVPFFLLPADQKLAYLLSPDVAPGSAILAAVNNAKLGHAFFYMVLTLVVLKRHRQRIRTQFSSLERINLEWLRNLMVIIVVVMLASVGLHLVSVLTLKAGPGLGLDPDSVYDDYTLLILAGFVYVIGFLGLRQPAVFHGDWESPRESPRYARSGVDPGTAEQISIALVRVMEEDHLHREGDLTLKSLAHRVDASPHHVTEVLNTRLEANFHDFVNGYRVREAQARLRSSEHAHLSVLAVGLDSGFTSKSSFNAVFKRLTGMTPSEYRNRST